MRPDFWKKVPTVQEGPKSPINGPEMSFYMGRGGFWQKANPFICTFLLKYYCSNGFLTFRKNRMSGKNLKEGKICSQVIVGKPLDQSEEWIL